MIINYKISRLQRSKTSLFNLFLFQPTILHLTPPLVSFLTTHPEVNQKHLESVHHILPAAAPVGAALIQQFKIRFPGITVREGTPILNSLNMELHI